MGDEEISETDSANERLARENERLKTRLEEAEETLHAIQHGEVDALVITGPEGEQVFTLKGAELPYRFFFEEMREGAVSLSAEGTILYANRSFSQLVDVPLEKILGTKINLFFPKEERSILEGILEESKRGVQGHGMGRMFIMNHDTRVPIQLSCTSSVLDKIPSTFLIITNMSESVKYETALKKMREDLGKKTQEALLQSEDLFGGLFRASPIPLSITRLVDGRLIDANESFLRLFEYDREEVIGHDTIELNIYNPTELAELIRELHDHDQIVNKEVITHTKTGRTIQLQTSYGILSFGGEEQLLTTWIDITGRKRAEETLHKLNVQLEEEVHTAALALREQAELLNKTRDAIIVRNLEDQVLFWNSGAELVYGWTAKEILGKKWADFFEDTKPTQPSDALKDVIEHGEWKGELQELTKTRKEITVDSHWTLVRDSDGQPKSIMVINSDITEQKKLEMQFLRAQRMESVGTLAGGIAHDLNNLLTPIILSLDYLENVPDDEKRQNLIVLLKKNVEKAANLARRVLTFARGSGGERLPVRLKRLIQDFIQTLLEIFPKNIEVITEIPPDAYDVLGDATQLHQVLMNLCVNARDAMPAGGTLKIMVSNLYIDEQYSQMELNARIGNYVMIAVADNGTGMSEGVLNHLFEPFFTTKGAGMGTGLGLTTTLAIIRGHGGFINVDSEPGKGTTFKVYLPAIPPKENVSTSTNAVLKSCKGNGEMILVADDEPLILKITADTLVDNGYKIAMANDGAEAIAEYLKNKEEIALVIVDMLMPIMDGAACIKALRKINPGVKIITVSGFLDSINRRGAITAVDGFIQKPYGADKLLQVIYDVLNKAS